MATYSELVSYYGTADFDTLRNRVGIAAQVKCKDISNDGAAPDHIKQWAVNALKSPLAQAGMLVNYVIAEHNDKTLEQINQVTDAQLLTAVSNAIDKLVVV